MLATTLVLDPDAYAATGAAFFNQLLWTGGVDAGGKLFLRWVDIQGGGATGQIATPFEFGRPRDGAETVTLLARGPTMWIVFGRIGEIWTVTSMSAPQWFSPAIPLPIEGGAVGPMALGSCKGGMALIWTEVFGARAHLLTSVDGFIWSDLTLPYYMGRNPALLADGAGAITVAFANNPLTQVTIGVLDYTSGTLDQILGNHNAPQEARGGTAMARVTYHGVERLHVAALRSGVIDFQASAVTLTGTDLGGEERGPGEVRWLSLATAGQLVYAVVGHNDNRLAVGPYIDLFAMPPELEDLIGRECQPGDCPPDPRISCQPTEDFKVDFVPPRIANARRGDLILTPADGEGTIGAILGALEPEQKFDHMGIMVEDHFTVRHCTMAHARVQESPRFMRGVLAGLKAPSDGFEPSGVRFGWPGTITQSVEDAFYCGWNTRWPDGSSMNPEFDFLKVRQTAGIPTVALPPPPAGTVDENFNKQQEFCDPEFPEDSYAIHNFPSTPQYHRKSGELRNGVVLKPASSYEAQQPAIRRLLSRIVDQALQIRGHYRFFAYSKADIANDPAMLGPAGHWSNATLPLVCSTFIWAAIDQLRAKGQDQLVLEGELAESPWEKLFQGEDGLYAYDAAERTKAAQSLHDALVSKIQQEVYLQLIKLNDEVSGITDVLKIGLAELLGILAGPLGAAAALLGVTPTKAGELAILLTDMPEQVANQLCNTFAFDKAEAIDSTDWQTPGEGRSVSPDDIAFFWDEPAGTAAGRDFSGLYGLREPLLLVPRRLERFRTFRLDRTHGPATAQGRVLYRGEAVAGAIVRAGCETTITRTEVADVDPSYRFDLLSAAPVALRAEAVWAETGVLLSGERIVKLVPGEQPGAIDIELQDPPSWRRQLLIWGDVYLIRKVLIGHDDIVRKPIVYRGDLAFIPSEWGHPTEEDDPRLRWSATGRSPYAQRLSIGYGIGVQLNDDLSMHVKVISAMCKDDYSDPLMMAADTVLASRTSEFDLPPGATVSKTISFEHNSVPPDRGRLTLNFMNQIAPA